MIVATLKPRSNKAITSSPIPSSPPSQGSSEAYILAIPYASIPNQALFIFGHSSNKVEVFYRLGFKRYCSLVYTKLFCIKMQDYHSVFFLFSASTILDLSFSYYGVYLIKFFKCIIIIWYILIISLTMWVSAFREFGSRATQKKRSTYL